MGTAQLGAWRGEALHRLERGVGELQAVSPSRQGKGSLIRVGKNVKGFQPALVTSCPKQFACEEEKTRRVNLLRSGNDPTIGSLVGAMAQSHSCFIRPSKVRPVTIPILTFITFAPFTGFPAMS